MNLWLDAFILGVLEGLTEFLPVSSTGHLILASSLLHFQASYAKTFEIAIQSGAIGAVLWEYRRYFFGLLQSLRGETLARAQVLRLILAFMPAAFLGLLLHKPIERLLFNPISVAVALVIGGLVILWLERRPQAERVSDINQITWRQALWIGLAQSLALVPGVSRSAATILGGMVCGLQRKTATEFSFLLAAPIIVAATIFSLVKERSALDMQALPVFAIGFVAAFISALLCIRWLLRFVAQHDFRPFAWYRIALGTLILLSFYGGWLRW